MPKLNRRQFLTSVSAAASSAALLPGCTSPIDQPSVSFDHGVASGDPLSDSVILWTRVTPTTETPQDAINVVWQVSTQPNFNNIVFEDSVSTSAERDYTVKIDVKALKPNTTYYYRFNVGQTLSPVGQTKTLPEGDIDSAKFAVVSCSNFGFGYFNVYEEISKQDDLVAVVHLGDYIYEYNVEKYNDPDLVGQQRKLLPPGELLVLDDYRQRYSLYRRDPSLQKLHAKTPFICVWDDHELANDAWMGGAENHQPDEGDWEQRKAYAIQAYREWLPIRDPENNENTAITYRNFKIGNLADLIMLDTRVIGRDKPIDYLQEMIWRQIPFDVSSVSTGGPGVPVLSADQMAKVDPTHIQMITVPFDLTKNPPTPILDWETITALDPKNLPAGWAFLPDAKQVREKLLNNSQRNLLGKAQEAWLENTLDESKQRGATWQILGQQVLTGEVLIPDVRDILSGKASIPANIINAIILLGQMGIPFNTDAWDGYNVARQRYLQLLKNHAVNAISLAGDTHNAWAFDLIPDGESESVAVEFATSSVSSPGMENYISTTSPEQLSERLVKINKNLRYQNSHQRGWMLLELTPEAAINQWQFVSTVKTKEYQPIQGPTYQCQAGKHKLEQYS